MHLLIYWKFSAAGKNGDLLLTMWTGRAAKSLSGVVFVTALDQKFVIELTPCRKTEALQQKSLEESAARLLLSQFRIQIVPIFLPTM